MGYQNVLMPLILVLLKFCILVLYEIKYNWKKNVSKEKRKLFYGVLKENYPDQDDG